MPPAAARPNGATAGRRGPLVDPLFDPERTPFGAHAPSPLLKSARRIGALPGNPLKKLLQNALAKTLKMRRNPVLDLEYAGLKLRLLPNENWGDRAIALKGRHSVEGDLDIFTPYAGKRAFYLDIGANVGVYALVALDQLGEGSRVLAVEPHPRTVAKLRFNIGVNEAGDRIDVAETALGAERGTLRLYAPLERDCGSNSLHPAHEGAGYVEVPVTTLHELLLERGVERVDIMKIDVEGYEDQVLAPFFEQAPESLWPETALVEKFHRDKWRTDVVALMTGLGYAVAAEDAGDYRMFRPRRESAE